MDEKQLITTRKTINDLINKVLRNLRLKAIHNTQKKEHLASASAVGSPIPTQHRVFQSEKNNAFQDMLFLGPTGDVSIQGDVSIHLLKVRRSLFQFLWGVKVQRRKAQQFKEKNIPSSPHTSGP